MLRNRVFFTFVCVLVCVSTAVAADELYKYGRWSPGAIYADGKDKATIEVATGPGVKLVTICSGSVCFGALNDRGVDGDKVAGDNIWTYTGITRNYFASWIPGITVSGYYVEVIDKNDKTTKYYLPSLGIAEKTKKREKVKKLAPDVYYGKWVVFLIDKQGIYFDGKLPVCDHKCQDGLEKAGQRFYDFFGDRFDFITFMPVVNIYHPGTYTENVPYYRMIQNKIRNIGIKIFDDSSDYGSKGKLKGFIYHSFGYGAILDHEIGHAWGIAIGDAEDLGFSGYGGPYHNTYGWHITQYSNQVGQMAAMPQLKLEKNGDGTWKATEMMDQEGSRPYAPLTLYCMGLIPPEDVPPLKILRNEKYSNFNRIPDSEFDTFTIEEIMAANGGERVPAYPNTQKVFTSAFVVITDHKPTKAEADYFSAIPQYFISKAEGVQYLTPFYTATGGRAKLKMRIGKPLKK